MRKRTEVQAAAVAEQEVEEDNEDVLDEEEERAIDEALYEAEFTENVENVTDNV